MGISSSKTVDRLVLILDSFSREKQCWSLTDLSEHLGLPKSTLYRFLVALEQHKIMRHDASDKRWHLGYRLSIWGQAATESTGLRHLARGHGAGLRPTQYHVALADLKGRPKKKLPVWAFEVNTPSFHPRSSAVPSPHCQGEKASAIIL